MLRHWQSGNADQTQLLCCAGECLCYSTDHDSGDGYDHDHDHDSDDDSDEHSDDDDDDKPPLIPHWQFFFPVLAFLGKGSSFLLVTIIQIVI
jgi:hypothetical protein